MRARFVVCAWGLAIATATSAAGGVCVGTPAECRGKEVADLVIPFEKNSDRLNVEAEAMLRDFARKLRDPRFADASFSVEGYTDASGTEAYNLDLSARRAQAVLGFLEGQGVDVSKLIARSYGEASPRTSDPFDPANRRVEARQLAQ